VLNDFTIVDLETTGLDPVAGRITEIAARRYKNGKLSAALAVLVWAGVEPEPQAVALNGLTAELLQQQGVGEYEALEALRQVLGSSVLVAHNAAFEVSWLHQAIMRMHRAAGPAGFYNNFLCTKTLAVELRAGSGISYSLKQLTHDYNIEWTGAAHRAMPDVVATNHLLKILLDLELGLLAAGELLNCCGVAAGKNYPLPAGLPAHVKEVKQ
jgi:DNA polymerase-3 subunit epsilon/DNA polymerase-3 subunit alpha (Gram-positive type)